MKMIWNKFIPRSEESKLKAWARNHYKPGTFIRDIWHPIIQRECQKINLESDIITSSCCRASTYVDIGPTYLAWCCCRCGKITEKITLKKE